MKTIIAKSLLFTSIGIVLNFIFKSMAAKLIDKEELGIFFTAIDIFSLTLLILVGFRSSMVVSFAKTKDDVNITNIFRYFLLVIVFISWLMVIPYLKHKMGVNIHYWYLVFLMLSMGLVAYLGNQIAMYRHYNIINKITLIEPSLVLAWFLIAYYGAGVGGYHALFISSVMATLGVALYIYIAKRKLSKEPAFQRVEMTDDMRQFLKNSIISTLEFGSSIVMIYLSIVLIMHYYTLDDLANFQVVVKTLFVYMITLFVFPIFRFILPELSKLIHRKQHNEVAKLKKDVYRFSFIVSALFFLFTWLFSEALIAWAFSKEYKQSYTLLLHLSPFFLFVMLNAYNIAYIKASGKFWWAFFLRISGSFIVLISFYLLNLFSDSIIIVALSLIWGYVGMFIISFVLERRLRQAILIAEPSC
jgi:O-antigen/teichoic acid export membrane protein